MKVNGEAIYGTTASPFAKLTWGRCTKKVGDDEATLYLHVFDWPSDGALLLPGLRGRVQSAKLLSGGGELATEATDDGVVVRVPPEGTDPIATVVKVVVEGPLRVEKVLPGPDAGGTIHLPAQRADIHNPGYGGQAKVEDKYGEPNVGFWTDARAWVEWAFRVETEGTYEAEATLAAPSPGSRLVFAVGDQQHQVTLPGTGGYDAFETVPVGRFRVSEPGALKVSVKPVEDGWKPVNLRSVVLKPVAP